MTKLTKPQTSYMVRAMERPRVAYGSDYRVVAHLLAKGYVCEVGRDPLCHAELYAPTRAGLEALLYDRKMEDWRHGSMATVDRVREVVAALAEQVPA